MTWKDILGYEKLYQISDTGLVKSLPFTFLNKNGSKKTIKEQLKKSQINHRGYPRVQLTKDSKKRIFSVHRLVALHFIGNPENKPEVNHINGVKHDNRVENLEWATKDENELHSIVTGLKPKGEKHHGAKITELHVRVIREALQAGYKQKAIANYFKVSVPTISSIKAGRNWGWL